MPTIIYLLQYPYKYAIIQPMRNKTNIETIDQTQPVILEMVTTELGSFSITGMYDDVAPYATNHVEAPQAPVKPEGHNVASYALQAVTGSLMERVATDVRVRFYDYIHGTRFMDALVDKRNTERDLRFAGSIGLLNVDPCLKHRKASAAVKVLR